MESIQDRKLKLKDYVFLASMLFGMFFGAGNLIFPVFLGQNAGSAVWPAIVGFCVTGVGLPLFGVAAQGVSKTENLMEMSSLVDRRYGYFYTCLLYLCIGPLFAIPRTATVSFSVGVLPMIPQEHSKLILCLFSLLFFAVVLYFSLKPSGILTWVGKILNPIFLVFLSILAVTAILKPMAPISAAIPSEAYSQGGFFQGFLDGYNTMDALASVAFGIVLIDALRNLGVHSPAALSGGTIKAGLGSTVLMAAIYCMLAVIGAQSQSVYGVSADGGEALYLIGTHYFGKLGGLLLGITVTVACLKTAIGLITSCASIFVELFPHSLSYKAYAILFCVVSFAIANFGLSAIISLSLPLLMFLYPLTITLIFLCLGGKWFDFDRKVFLAVTIPTLLAAILDFLNSLPAAAQAFLHTEAILAPAAKYLPFFTLGLGWLVPALLGLVVGLILHFSGAKKQAA